MGLKSRLLFVIISCFIWLHSTAQIKVVKQKRFEHEGGVSTSVTPSKKVITYSIVSEKGKEDQIEILAFSEELEEQGRFQATCAEKNIFRTHALSGSGEYYFSLMIDKRREIHSVVFNTSTFEGAELYVDLEKKFEPNGNIDFLGGSSVACFKNKFFILGTIKKVPCILVYNMLTGTQHITFIPGVDKKMLVSFLSTNESAPSLQVMFYNYKSKKNEAQFIASVNEFGEVQGYPVSIISQKEKMLIDGNVTWLDEHTSLVCGATGENTTLAKGLYILEMKDGAVVQRSDFDFNDFKDFYSHFNEKVQKRMERKKSRNKNFDSKCYMVTHPITFNENSWTILGEVFYPTTRTEYRTTYVNGKPVTQTVSVFDGFQYTNAVILQVNQDLEKIKDYTFKLKIAEKPYDPKKFIRTVKVGTKLNFFYADIYNFGHVSLENGGLEESPMIDIVDQEKDLKESEKVTNRIDSNVDYWYDDYYLITETFQLKDKDESFGNKRKMYVQFKKLQIQQ